MSKNGKFSIISGVSKTDEDVTIQKDEAFTMFKDYIRLSRICWTEDEFLSIIQKWFSDRHIPEEYATQLCAKIQKEWNNIAQVFVQFHFDSTIVVYLLIP
jgi:hypothetical protein